MKTKNKINPLVLAILLIIIQLPIASCTLTALKGNGNIIKQERTVDSFNSIEVSGAFSIILSQGTPQSVRVEADENLMAAIKTEVKGTTLKIYTNKSIQNCHSMKVYIVAKEMKEIETSGAVDLETSGKLTGSDLKLDFSGASDSKLEIGVAKLIVDCSGGSKIKLTGSATDVNMDISGAADIYAFDMSSEKYDLDVSGAGNVQINVTKELKADVSGAASVRYKGNPANLIEDVSGAGSVKKAD